MRLGPLEAGARRLDPASGLLSTLPREGGRMRIRGVLRDDMQTRTRLVEHPADQLDLLVHVLLVQSSEIELQLESGALDGDPALKSFVEHAIDAGATVSLDRRQSLVSVSLADPET